MVPIGPAVRVPMPIMLRHTNIRAPSNFVFLTHHCRSNNKCSCHNIIAFITRGRFSISHCIMTKSYIFHLSGFVAIHNPLTNGEAILPQSLSRTVSFPPQSDPPFVRKDRSNEITIHVPPTLVKGAPPLLTKRIEPTHAGYQSAPGLSRIHPLVWPTPLTTDFVLQWIGRSHMARAASN